MGEDFPWLHIASIADISPQTVLIDEIVVIIDLPVPVEPEDELTVLDHSLNFYLIFDGFFAPVLFFEHLRCDPFDSDIRVLPPLFFQDTFEHNAFKIRANPLIRVNRKLLIDDLDMLLCLFDHSFNNYCPCLNVT